MSFKLCKISSTQTSQRLCKKRPTIYKIFFRSFRLLSCWIKGRIQKITVERSYLPHNFFPHMIFWCYNSFRYTWSRVTKVMQQEKYNLSDLYVFVHLFLCCNSYSWASPSTRTAGVWFCWGTPRGRVPAPRAFHQHRTRMCSTHRRLCLSLNSCSVLGYAQSTPGIKPSINF